MVALCLLLAGSAEALLGLYQFVRRVGPEGFLLMGRFMRAMAPFSSPSLRRVPRATAPLASACWRQTGAACGQGGARATGPAHHRLGRAGQPDPDDPGLVASWSRGGWLGFARALALMAIASAGERWRRRQHSRGSGDFRGDGWAGHVASGPRAAGDDALPYAAGLTSGRRGE